MSARHKAIHPSLFDPPRPAAERTPPDLDFIRKHLHRVLRLVRNAEGMPWGPADTAHWEKFFPELTALLPPEEGRELLTSFTTEISRLRVVKS